MALFDNILEGNVATGLAIGIGLAILGPIVVPRIANVAAPIAKAAIKSGVQLYERGKETIAGIYEITEDIVAEAKAELIASTTEHTQSETTT